MDEHAATKKKVYDLIQKACDESNMEYAEQLATAALKAAQALETLSRS